LIVTGPNTVPQWFIDFVTSKGFQDAVRNAFDRKWLADNVPLTGAKAEGAGLKLDVSGGQFEYGLVKHEKVLFDINKIMEGRAQQKREQDVDRRLAGLQVVDRQLREQLSSLKNKVGKVSQVANDGNQRSISGRAKVRDLTVDVTTIARAQRAGAQRLRSQISSLKSKISRISQVANDANERSKSLRIKANNLDQQVRAGLRRVEALEDGARRAGRSVESLRGAINSLERALRD
jgi:chromosome segregation ATPase